MFNKKPRLMAGILSILILISTFSGLPAFAASFTDVAGHWAEPYIYAVEPLGVISGFPDGSYKPEQTLTRIQFIKMVVASLKQPVRTSASGEYWGIPYVEAALSLRLISDNAFDGLSPINVDKKITRQEMASIVVNAYKSTGETVSNADMQAAASKLTDLNKVSPDYYEQSVAAVALGFIGGFPDNTFRPLENASRAQAAKVTYILLVEIGTLSANLTDPSLTQKTTYAVNGIELGDSLSWVLSKYGQPIREDASEYGFKWLVYHQNYKNYFLVGIQNNTVVGLYTASDLLTSTNGLKINQTKTSVTSTLGAPLKGILKGYSEFQQYDDAEVATYLNNKVYITTYYDTQNSGKMYAIKIVDYNVEQAFKSHYGTASEALKTAYEKELFDLVNVFRTSLNLNTLTWNEAVAVVTRKHSVDMAVRKFFDHTNPSGYTPFDRLLADGVDYTLAAENIAAGYTNAFSTHNGWVNSPGHRENLVRNVRQVGIGVHFGGDYRIYYTQDFITP